MLPLKERAGPVPENKLLVVFHVSGDANLTSPVLDQLFSHWHVSDPGSLVKQSISGLHTQVSASVDGAGA